MNTEDLVSDLVEKGRIAQQKFERYSQEQVDQVVKAIGKIVYDNGEELAKMAVEETKMGDYDSKVLKNKNKPLAVWHYLKDKKSVGIIRYIEEEGIVEVAKPIGVIGAITPVTNPILTPVSNAMIILKGRNAVVFCPHPAARKCGKATIDNMRAALKKLDAPEDLIQCIEEPTLELSAAVMKLTDACVSTGGAGLVKVAYSSGKPAFGVGSGNCQCLIDVDADIPDAVQKIITGRAFDNGMLCTCEQAIICQETQYDMIIDEFKKQGAYYTCDPQEVKRIRAACFQDGKMNKDLVGRSAYDIAGAANIKVSKDNRIIIVKTDGPGEKDAFGKEKLFPVLAAYKYKTWEDAVSIANANLQLDGKGHSICIHSFTKKNIEYAANSVTVSRFLVNGIGSSGLGGAYTNGFVPTGTLGCGSWGNNSISENLGYIHLINISRIAYTNPNAHIPAPDEIWG